MFCNKCGNEINDNNKFCDKCGTPLADDVAAYSKCDAGQKTETFENANNMIAVDKKKKKRKKILIILGIIIAVIIIIIYWISTHSLLSVDDVKNGRLIGHSEKTIGEALEGYFTNCTWESFVGDTDDAIDVVEFNGYDSTGQKFTMQFICNYSDKDDDTDFELYGAWLDDEPFYDYEIDSMLDCIYSGETWISDY